MLAIAAVVILQVSAAFGAQLYHHKTGHASIVLNNTLYIDGGELATWDGTGTGLYNGSSSVSRASDPNTYSVDLSSSWSNSSVNVITILKDTPSFVQHTLWKNPTQQSFFSYDGGVSLIQAPYAAVQANQLWAYSPNSQSDRWSLVSTTGNFSSLERLEQAGYASGGGLGFALGGYSVTYATVNDTSGNPGIITFRNGLVMYNATSQQWYNITLTGDYAVGSANAAAHYVSNFGPAGLLLFFGGVSASGNYGHIPLDRLTMFEPISQQTRTQRVTGDVPVSMESACVVGAAGENGTYEIFLLGGLQAAVQGWQNVDNSIYVLSLPSFHWTKIPSYGPGRTGHACNVAASRQMLVVGGTVAPGAFNASWSFDRGTGGPDPWPQGLGVFDMTALQWSSSFDPSAAQYTTPNVIRNYINANGNAPSSYDDTTVQSWFATMRAAVVTSNSTSGGSSVSGTSTTSTNGSTTSGSAGLTTGAIVGIVVGVIAGLTLVALAVFFILRKRRQQHTAIPANDGEVDVPEGFYHSSQLNSKNTSELHGQNTPPELSGTAFYELPAPKAAPKLHELGQAEQQVYELDHSIPMSKRQ